MFIALKLGWQNIFHPVSMTLEMASATWGADAYLRLKNPGSDAEFNRNFLVKVIGMHELNAVIGLAVPQVIFFTQHFNSGPQ